MMSSHFVAEIHYSKGVILIGKKIQRRLCWLQLLTRGVNSEEDSSLGY
jgi:hypothetical protein